MKVTEAAALIESGVQPWTAKATTWADLGCGSGTFTKALASLLGDGSKIYAVDKVSQSITSSETNAVDIEFFKIDFIHEELPFSNLDGVLMANSLHYVNDKLQFIENVKKHLKAEGQMIIVEYDTEKRNPWIPYPVSFEVLRKILSGGGFTHIKKIGERNSIYRVEKMYACSVKLL